MVDQMAQDILRAAMEAAAEGTGAGGSWCGLLLTEAHGDDGNAEEMIVQVIVNLRKVGH